MSTPALAEQLPRPGYGGRLSLRAPSGGVLRNLQLARAGNALHIVLPGVTLPAEEWSAAAGTGAFVDPRPAR